MTSVLLRLRKAVELAERMGVKGSHASNIYVIADAAADRIEALEAALTEIASLTQTEKLLWWQERARAALFAPTPDQAASAIERLSAIEQERDALREALTKVKEAIESPLNKFAVADTIWMLGEPFPTETLLDFIDAALNHSRTE